MNCELCRENLSVVTCRLCARKVCASCMDTTACVYCVNGLGELEEE